MLLRAWILEFSEFGVLCFWHGSSGRPSSTVFPVGQTRAVARPLRASELYSSGLATPPHSKMLRMVSPTKSRLTTTTAGVVNQVFTIAGKLCSLRQKLRSFLKFRSSVTAVTIIPP